MPTDSRSTKTIMDHLNPTEYYRAERSPYYIYAPDYQEGSSGIRVLHYLCHILNLHGQEAYVHANVVNEALWIPKLTKEIMHRHYLAGRKPIVIYPEVAVGTPLGLGVKIRYLLNKPGFVAGHTEFDDDEIFVAYREAFIADSGAKHLLFLPACDPSKFNLEGTNPSNRSGIYFFYYRLLTRGGQLLPLTDNAIEISPNNPRSLDELAVIFKRAELLYCYEDSAIALEARMCGCPVVYIPNATMLPEYPKDSFGRDGAAWGTSAEEIAKAKETVHKVFPAYARLYDDFNSQLQKFIVMTQEAARRAGFDYCFPAHTVRANGWQATGDLYESWRANRATICDEGNLVEQYAASMQDGIPGFHLCMRLPQGSEALLADTIDSMFGQHYPNWHLDVITPLPAPDGLESIPCISWHTIPEASKHKAAIDTQVELRNLDLCVELPPGATPDPLCFWRIAKDMAASGKYVGAFVDDDLIGTDGKHHTPRFKPGVNPAQLISSDLAGPLFLRREAWMASGGASERQGSPWFSQLLRVADTFGWHSILHIPDILFSYRGSFPSDIESCLIGLVVQQQTKGMTNEIVPVTSRSWNIRNPLTAEPMISVAVLSQGHLDYLPRCVDSILKKTSYSNFEILITLSEDACHPDIIDWIERAQCNSASVKIRLVRVQPASNHAARCNAAVRACSNDYILFIREEAVVIQEKWLEELVRTCLPPGIAAASPCLIAPSTSKITDAGNILGLKEIVGSPYQDEAKLGDPGYLDTLRIARDANLLSGACLLVRKGDYLAAEGMDENCLGDHFADADLCLKLRSLGHRTIYQPLATVVYGGPISFDLGCDIERKTNFLSAQGNAKYEFLQRWLNRGASDPYWNPNLSLTSVTPIPETEYQPQWRYFPSSGPRILARQLTNGQGIFRVTAPLRALCKAGMASECLWPQEENDREPNVQEIQRLAPDAIIVQHYINDPKLAGLDAWKALPSRPFIVYALDDLLTNMAESNPFRKRIPANSRTRLSYALERCDRLVVSTDYLASEYRHLNSDIRVVPNRLEQELWLPLRSRRRIGKKPRIGWAGGTTHQGDLILLKEIIEQTRHEADWIFFGMCPEEILPLLAEYHSFASFTEYPAKLAALSLDIAVAPLAEIPFNQGKSNLRLLEYGILGIPVVCTDIDPYQGSPACRVANTVAAWTKALRDRIHDADAREQEGAALRHWVLEGYLLENHLDEWLDAHLPN